MKTTSGSERKTDGSAFANVIPTRVLSCICFTPSSRYSTGSSIEMMLFDRVLISDSTP